MVERKPIFYDAQSRRWRHTRRAMELSGAVMTLLLIAFVINVVILRPQLPKLLPDYRPPLHAIRTRLGLKTTGAKQQRRLRRVAALGKVPANYDPLRAAFYVATDATSLASLQQHYRDIDLLIPEGLQCISADGRLDIAQDAKLFDWMKSVGTEIPVMTLLQNSDGTVWHTPEMALMLAHPAARKNLTTSIFNFAVAQHQPGVVLDFEEVPENSQDDFRTFVGELAAQLHTQNLKLMVALPAADWSYDYKTIAQHADAIILMNYDQHWVTSDPGPITAQDWYLHNLKTILTLVPAEKIVMGIAAYAYDWPVKSKANRHPVALPKTFQEAMVTSVESEAPPEFDSDTLNLHYSYSDENNVDHEVWMLDGITAYNEMRAAERAGVQGTAMWRLGQEDQSIWNIWDATRPTDAIRAKMADVPPGYDLILEGAGDIWKITNGPEPGKRTFDYDDQTDTFTDENFVTYPLSWRIDQMGASPDKIALSFDDGPDPEYTPQILNILKAKHVPASFFVIGEEADRYPQILHREFNEGNEIGNHTFTHPDMELISKTQFELELNLTERLLESSLGVKTLLFRPPYGIDHQPETASEIDKLPIPQSMGYIIVGAMIDPHDWGEAGGGAPPPTDTIVQRVVEQTQPGKGNIVLMHDGGGIRANTVAALPRVIDALRARGYQFVQVSDLLGQTRAQVMPSLTHEEWLFARADALIFELFHWLRLGIAYIFIAGILLVSCRALIIGLLALAEKMRAAPLDHAEYKPAVTVLIPAFNEESVIVDTVTSALASTYTPLEILVIDDGSSDRTSELVISRFAGDRRVRLLSQTNRGKPAALNNGMAAATGEIVVSIDADTQVEPNAIALLVRHFANPKVGAVAGNVKVRNRDRWLTRWQALEYITSQNLEKRAFDLLNCIPVVPGAVGAWRTDLIRSCGGFSGDTVAEDTDLTLTIRRHGWKILYDEDAIGRTEVPDTAEALIKQRFRWTFGTLQAVWKHRDTLGRKKYGSLGLVALPNVFLFQIMLPLISPVIDLLFILSVVLWGLAQLRITRLPQLWTAQDVERSLIFFAAFMLIDFFTCVVAFALERHEDWTLLAPLLIQRFYYRQMMYVVLFRALREAVRGRPVGWRGVEPHLPVPAGGV